MREPRWKTRAAWMAIWIGLAASASAQDFAFGYRTSANTSPQGIAANGELDAPPVALGSTSTVTLIIQNQTGGLWTLTNASVAGPVFKVTSTSNSQVLGGGTLLVTVSFTPTAGVVATDNLSIQLVNGSQNDSYVFLLSGNGLKANFIASYILNPDGNQTALGTGMPIVFSPTNLGSTATATFILLNSGTGAGTIQSVGVSGTGFTVSGLALLPAQVPANSSFQFTINFAPKTRGALTGTLSVGLGGTQLSIPLQGQSVGASLTYSAVIGSQTFNLATGGLTFPSTNLGSKSSATVQISNSGDAAAPVNTISVVGTGFGLSNVPPLPTTLNPGTGFTFTVMFTPQSAGAATGTLIIDSVSIALSSTGVGATLQYSSVVGTTNTTLVDGGTVVFPNTDIGAKSSVSIVISNTGNSAATVSAISAGGTAFSVTGLPALPATIAAGANLQFLVWFSAGAVGTTSGSLQIDSVGLNLKGVGNQPPPLGQSSITGLPQTTTALTQPAVGLSLSQAYPLPISGVLTLSFASDSFSDDPNIQFATGGRTVAFTIPANTTDAMFNGSKQIQFQSGTVAGVITLTASFSLGSVNITPATAPVQTVLVAAAPPQLRNVQLGTVTANSFELLITGLSTPRSVSSLTLQFVSSSGANLQTSSLSINTDAPFGTWFQSATGIGFGSQFTASVIVNVTGDITAVQAVNVTASNSRGNSNALSVNLR